MQLVIDYSRKDYKRQQCVHCKHYERTDRMVRFGFDDVPRLLIGYYHPECAKAMFEESQRACLCCGVLFFPSQRDTEYGLCHKCKQDEKLRAEFQRVRDERWRARKYKLPETLTVKEWIETLDHFGQRCAYCGGRFQVLEHFIPLERGGGTTKHNCVPACISCNKIKDSKDPFQTRIKNIAGVVDYLKSR
jgi:5-methylcytosine-specific restriction endonuclease McrA